MGAPRRVTVLLLAVANLAVVDVWRASASQLPPITLLPPAPTTTAQAPPTGEPETTTTESVPADGQPSGEAPADGEAPPDGEVPAGDVAPEGVVDPAAEPGAGVTPEQGGDGGAPVPDGEVGRVVPPAAQAVIDSVPRSAPSDNLVLVAGAEALIARGIAAEEAVRTAFGNFPVAGPASWSDDWLYPRWTGPQFRYHLGCDVMAAYGTPVLAVAAGVVRFSESALGGLGLYLWGEDGNVYYYAHLSALTDGLAAEQHVAAGDVVGFVGDSGNAEGSPHLHFAVHPAGGDPVPPKPFLDQWVADGDARVAAVLASATVRRSRALVATGYLRDLADSAPGDVLEGADPTRTDLLFASSASPAGGGLHLASASAAAAARTVDWEARALRQRAFAEAWDREADRARTVLDPLTPAALVDAVGSLVAGAGTGGR